MRHGESSGDPRTHWLTEALKELEAAAPTLRVELQRLEVRSPGDFEGAFKAATRQRAGALIAPGDPLFTNRPQMVADLALKYRLPTMMDNKEFVEAGGLPSLGVDLPDLYRRAATHVDKILTARPRTVASLRPRSSPALNVQEYASARRLPASLICSVLGRAPRPVRTKLDSFATTLVLQEL